MLARGNKTIKVEEERNDIILTDSVVTARAVKNLDHSSDPRVYIRAVQLYAGITTEIFAGPQFYASSDLRIHRNV